MNTIPKGFTIYDTGGGCDALHKLLGNKHYFLITNEDGQIPNNDDICLVGLYEINNFNDSIVWKFNNLKKAIAMVENATLY